MKKLLAIIILSLCCTTVSQADNISDFEIEGMSVGDSLLDYFTVDIISANKKNSYDWIEKNKNKFSVSEIIDKKKFQTYDVMQFVYKTNDPKYIIYAVSGIINYKNNIKDCYTEKDTIEKELKNLFSDLSKTGLINKKHNADASGKSYVTLSDYKFPNDSHRIVIECTDWSKKMKQVDNLRIQIKLKEFNDWLFNR